MNHLDSSVWDAATEFNDVQLFSHCFTKLIPVLNTEKATLSELT